MSKDIDICKKVILNAIDDLKIKEEEATLTKDKCKCMEQRLILSKSLEIILCQNNEDIEQLTFTCDCCGEIYNMKDRHIIFSRELCPECYI